MDSTDSVSNLKSRFQFTVVVALFLPVILESLFKLASNELNVAKNILSYGAIISVFILNYLIIELIQKHFLKWVLKTLNFLILLNISVYGILILLLAIADSVKSYLSVYTWAYAISLYATMVIPLLTLFILVINIGYISFKDKNERGK